AVATVPRGLAARDGVAGAAEVEPVAAVLRAHHVGSARQRTRAGDDAAREAAYRAGAEQRESSVAAAGDEDAGAVTAPRDRASSEGERRRGPAGRYADQQPGAGAGLLRDRIVGGQRPRADEEIAAAARNGGAAAVDVVAADPRPRAGCRGEGEQCQSQ